MKYQTGDQTLKKIGNKLGSITPTMVNRLHNSAIDKFKALTYNKPLENFTFEEDENFTKFIISCREKAANEFISLLKEKQNDLFGFLILLKKKQYINDGDLKLITENEINKLIELKLLLQNNNIEIVKKILFNDIEKNDNHFTVYQNVVSRIAFPNKKRGRPRKEK